MCTIPMDCVGANCASRLCESSIDMGALRETFHQHVTELCRRTQLVAIQNEIEIQNRRGETLRTFERVLGISIQALDRNKRLTVPDGLQENAPSTFWKPTAMDPSIHVSKYYKNEFVCFEGRLQRTESCTTVINRKVIIPVEIYICQIDVILYKDIMTNLSHTLGDVLEIFNLTQGFPVDTAYTYMSCVNDEWHCTRIEPCMLTTSLYEILLRRDVQQANNMDYFRISPVGVDELI